MHGARHKRGKQHAAGSLKPAHTLGPPPDPTRGHPGPHGAAHPHWPTDSTGGAAKGRRPHGTRRRPGSGGDGGNGRGDLRGAGGVGGGLGGDGRGAAEAW